MADTNLNRNRTRRRNQSSGPVDQSDSPKRTRRSKIRKQKSKRRLLWTSLLTAAVLYGGFVLSYDARLWLAGSLLVTQHSDWAKYTLVGDEAINKLKAQIAQPDIVNSQPAIATASAEEQDPAHEDTTKPAADVPLIQVEPVERRHSAVHYFKGHVMKVSDPSRVHLVQTIVKTNRGKPRGEWISEFSERTQALGGINASGFYDPNYMGYASEAAGLIIVDGKMLQDYNHTGGDTALGITYDGKLVTGNYSGQQLLDMGVRDAMSFRPQLIVNGKNMFEGQEATSWGIAPRTAVGQTEDGTILFIVIDGRRAGHSLGASMKDMADLMQEYGAVNAMAMDGGTSAMMVHEGKILTKSSIDDERGRWIPNAWMVY
ncbi:phosphodiester glycosidase family protein [Brevibacillus dissolubilis]|uniref:phosphodiester glycosidase family protein n=1 Tax=Brevibacillus dissolubilis TaxID=1844116 RepID=UPI0011162F8D|nr:phosphodiester glycosidase family protein [Brevibacillus dissolubilis]